MWMMPLKSKIIPAPAGLIVNQKSINGNLVDKNSSNPVWFWLVQLRGIGFIEKIG